MATTPMPATVFRRRPRPDECVRKFRKPIKIPNTHGICLANNRGPAPVEAILPDGVLFATGVEVLVTAAPEEVRILRSSESRSQVVAIIDAMLDRASKTPAAAAD